MRFLQLPTELKRYIVELVYRQDRNYCSRIGNLTPTIEGSLLSPATPKGVSQRWGKSSQSLSLVSKELRALSLPFVLCVSFPLSLIRFRKLISASARLYTQAESNQAYSSITSFPCKLPRLSPISPSTINPVADSSLISFSSFVPPSPIFAKLPTSAKSTSQRCSDSLDCVSTSTTRMTKSGNGAQDFETPSSASQIDRHLGRLYRCLGPRLYRSR